MEAEPEVAQVNSAAPNSPVYTAKDYLPLKIGNYWVYQLQQVDQNTNVVYTTTDSTYVSDSIITRGKTFYNVVGNIMLPGYYCDSSNCIISSDGDILLRISSNKNDTLSRTNYSQGNSWFNRYYIMQSGPASFSFNGVTYSDCSHLNGHFYSNMNAACPNRFYPQIFSPGIGMVYSKYFFASLCDDFEHKLLRYKVN